MPDEAVLRKYTLPESVVNSQELRYDPREDVWVVSSGGVSTLDLSRA
jgi:streptogramin lyase